MTNKPLVEQCGPPAGSTLLYIRKNADHHDRFQIALTTDFQQATGVMRRADLIELANKILVALGAA